MNSKFEKFKKIIIDNLNNANLTDIEKNKFIDLISNIQYDNDYKNNYTNYSFQSFKVTLKKISIDNFNNKTEYERFQNFVNYAYFQPGGKITVYPALNKFENFKKEIYLPKFMVNFGFEIRKGESSRNSIKVKNNETGELFIIKKNNNNEYTFYDPINNLFKGASIIDFMLSRYNNNTNKNFTLNECNPILEHYLQNNNTIENIDSNNEVRELSFSEEICSLKKIYDKKFLYSRGISDDIIESNYLKNKIFNAIYKNKEQTFCNTAFIMQSENSFVAISKRNETFKGITGNKSEGIFITNDLEKGNTIDNIYIFESAIDVLSYMELNKNVLKKKVRFISTEGSFSDNQIELINLVIKKQNPKNIIFCQDNDIGGEHQITKILSKLVSSNDIIINPLLLKNKSNVELLFSKNNELIKLTKTFLDDTKFSYANTVINDKINLKIEFENNIENWQKINSFIKDLKFGNSNFSLKRELSKNKDFNEDLKKINSEKKNKIISL